MIFWVIDNRCFFRDLRGLIVSENDVFLGNCLFYKLQWFQGNYLGNSLSLKIKYSGNSWRSKMLNFFVDKVYFIQFWIVGLSRWMFPKKKFIENVFIYYQIKLDWQHSQLDFTRKSENNRLTLLFEIFKIIKRNLLNMRKYNFLFWINFQHNFSGVFI